MHCLFSFDSNSLFTPCRMMQSSKNKQTSDAHPVRGAKRKKNCHTSLSPPTSPTTHSSTNSETTEAVIRKSARLATRTLTRWPDASYVEESNAATLYDVRRADTRRAATKSRVRFSKEEFKQGSSRNVQQANQGKHFILHPIFCS